MVRIHNVIGKRNGNLREGKSGDAYNGRKTEQVCRHRLENVWIWVTGLSFEYFFYRRWIKK